jgi:hypothetical protein
VIFIFIINFFGNLVKNGMMGDEDNGQIYEFFVLVLENDG